MGLPLGCGYPIMEVDLQMKGWFPLKFPTTTDFDKEKGVPAFLVYKQCY